jgi:hypothetical protein
MSEKEKIRFFFPRLIKLYYIAIIPANDQIILKIYRKKFIECKKNIFHL